MISIRSGSPSVHVRRLTAVVAGAVLLLASLPTVAAFHDWGGWAAAPGGLPVGMAEELDGHLVVSEVMTGGAGASDELIELYNPGPAALPLEGLEIIYVTASGGTITRKATWSSGSPSVPAGAHVLVANAAGIFASVADVTYVNGLAATGGSVAIRILGASSAIDAVGWGNATGTWLEGTPTGAAAAGHSIERLPGGSGGSGQDSDQNSVDFVELGTPDPQNSLSPPISVATPAPTDSPSISPTPPSSASPTPAVTAEPTAAASTTPTSSPTPTSTPSPSVAPITIAAARATADGATVLVEGTSLTDSTFADGGGYLADTTGGIAILLSDGGFMRGMTVRVSGVLDDRFSQRTIRADAAGVTVVGPSLEPAAQGSTTGAIGEGFEGELVEVSGIIAGAPTVLTTGLAVDLDDGSGAIRVLASNATAIDTAGWIRGASLHVRGVVGQRDSSGSGTAGYRVQPRDTADVLSLMPPTTPSPSA
ncbi:MAG TPA: lamin tail domain-containing protein, partial [Candidatus Limnocylindrales bacterium]|nr:lamin tail domain-containing protein [Candidatus Limnocylindrales bacterium]